jgi:isoleucyl-tRNA synthetase
VVVKLARLLAPFIPFMTESMYQNLVRSVYPQAYESIHHTAWPNADKAIFDDDLLAQMALARQIASLGLSARNTAGLKVRRPLSKALAYAGKLRSLREELVEIVKDELNVKGFEFVEDASHLVTYKLLPDNKLLGPRFGATFPKVRAALAAADGAKVAAAVQSGLPWTIVIDGTSYELAPEEILVQSQSAEGLAVASDKNATVAVDATLTPELRLEGLAREVVRRIQDMRKKAGFNIEDRITTFYQTEGDGCQVMERWGALIAAETLTTKMVDSPATEGAYTESHSFEGIKMELGVRKNQ